MERVYCNLGMDAKQLRGKFRKMKQKDFFNNLIKKLLGERDIDDEIVLEMQKRTALNLRFLNISVFIIIFIFVFIDKTIIDDIEVYRKTNILRVIYLSIIVIPLIWFSFKADVQKFTQPLLIFNALSLGLFLGVLSYFVREYPVALFHNTVSIFLLNICLYVVFSIRIRYAIVLSALFLFFINFNYSSFYEAVGQVAVNLWFIIVTIVGTQVAKVMDSMLKRAIQMNMDMKKANQSKYKLFSMVSHDLKNMIAAQYTIADYLKDDDESTTATDRNRMVDLLHCSAEDVLNLFEDLLVWIKTQIEAIHPLFKAVDVEGFHRSIVSQMQPALETKQVELQITSEVAHEMVTDANILGLILRNILGNSIKYSHSNSAIQFHYTVQKNAITYQIIDTGIGMTEEKLNHLFNPEQVQSEAGTKGEKGTGLGLLLTKELVTLLHGTLSIKSTPQQGTQVMVTLPNQVIHLEVKA